MKLLPFLLTLPLILQAAEPSVFGAGDLDAPNPYGLTEAEKHIVKNRETLKTIESTTRQQNSKVMSIQERIDGLQSIIEGLNSSNHKNGLAIHSLEKKLQTQSELYNQDKESIESAIEDLRQMTHANVENGKNIKVVLTELSELIDTINSNYVTKKEYNSLVRDINGFKILIAKELKAINRSIDSVSTTQISNPELAKRAYKYFKASKYTKAIEDYEVLIKNQYKPARAHYMIGESYYYMKKYSEALAYFKESAARYDKADYMPTLMLHSAVAMLKTGDKEHAKAFLEAVIAQYPDAKAAQSAQKELDKLLQ